MRILITAATAAELLPAREILEKIQNQEDNHLYITVVETGIGCTATAYHTLKALTAADKPYDLVVNTGIAGSLRDSLPIGSAVRVMSDYFGDCGVQTASGFESLFDARLLGADTFPFTSGRLRPNPLPAAWEYAAAPIPLAEGVTVQHLVETGLSATPAAPSAQVETMEGAAFFYVCLLEGIPCMALRTISNKAGERDKTKWDIPFALSELRKAINAFIYKL